MIIQWYLPECEARIFDNEGHAICNIIAYKNRKSLKGVLAVLNLRIRGKWQKADWGMEAKLRKIKS